MFRNALWLILAYSVPLAPVHATETQDTYCVNGGSVFVNEEIGRQTIGYPYNPYIISSFNTVLAEADKLLGSKNHGVEEDIVQRARQQKDVIETYLAEFPGSQDVRIARNVVPLPAFSRSFLQSCDGKWFNKIVDEPALTHGAHSPRLLGDICAPVPKFLVISGSTDGWPTIGQFFHSPLADGVPLDASRVMQARDYRKIEDHFDELVIDFATLASIQCGRIPDLMQIAVSYADTADEALLYRNFFYVTVRYSDNRFKAVFEDNQHRRAKDVFKAAMTRKKNAAQRETPQSQPSELDYMMSTPEGRFALGALMVFGAMAGMAANSPCWDNPNHISC